MLSKSITVAVLGVVEVGTLWALSVGVGMVMPPIMGLLGEAGGLTPVGVAALLLVGIVIEEEGLGRLLKFKLGLRGLTRFIVDVVSFWEVEAEVEVELVDTLAAQVTELPRHQTIKKSQII